MFSLLFINSTDCYLGASPFRETGPLRYDEGLYERESFIGKEIKFRAHMCSRQSESEILFYDLSARLPHKLRASFNKHSKINKLPASALVINKINLMEAQDKTKLEVVVK